MDDRHPNDPVTGDPVTGPPTGRVRIIGAEPVGPLSDAAGDADAAVDTPTGGGEPDRVPGLDADMADWASPATDAELPHWTELPTGEVPSIVARDRGATSTEGDAWSALPAPTWREEHSDWEAHEDVFEPSMLSSDDLTMSDRHDSLDEERQPWTFDLSARSRSASASDPVGDPAQAEAVWEPDAFVRSAGIEGRHDDQTVMVPAVRPDSAPADEFDTTRFLSEPEPSSGADADLFVSAAPLPTSATGEPGEPGDPTAPEGPQDGEPMTRRRLDRGGTPDAATPVVLVDGDGDDPLEGDDPRVASPSGILPSGLRSRLRRDRDRPAVGAPGGAAVASASGPATATPRPRPVPQAPADSLIVRKAPPLRPPSPPQAPPGRAGTGAGAGPQGANGGGTGGRDLPVAVIAGVLLGLAVVVTFKLGTVPAMVVATVVVLIATVEAFNAFRRAGHRPAVLLGWVATVSLMVATYNKGLVALPLLLVMTVLLTMLWYLSGVERGADPLQGTATTVFVFCWTGVFGSFAALLLSPSLFPHRHGLAFLMGAILTTVAYDVAALGIGSWIGSRSLAPSVSPGKTWEGAIGGGVAAVLVGVAVVHFIHPWTSASAAVLGLVVAVVAPLGDLFESVVKRQLGLKDMGRILPGHGGILDRVDGLLFVLPATYYLVKAFHLG